MNQQQTINEIEKDWKENPRWKNIKRTYSAKDVAALRGAVKIEHTLAQLAAKDFWEKINTRPYVGTLGSLTGNQAVQLVSAGLEAIYMSGWQVAADANLA